jgi:nitrite reductase/ring-hydroxylating ferredoxin subunit
MTPIVLCRLAAVPDDQGLRVNIAGYPPLAVFRLDGQAHVTDDTCTHGEASLCEGEIEDGAVVCPYHLGAFDIRTGGRSPPPARSRCGCTRFAWSTDRWCSTRRPPAERAAVCGYHVRTPDS